MATYLSEFDCYVEDGLWDIHDSFNMDLDMSSYCDYNPSIFTKEAIPEVIALAKKQEEDEKEWIGSLEFKVGMNA